jgi:hypothetical protein
MPTTNDLEISVEPFPSVREKHAKAYSFPSVAARDGDGPRPSDGDGPKPSDGDGPKPSDGDGPRPSDGDGPKPSDGDGPEE